MHVIFLIIFSKFNDTNLQIFLHCTLGVFLKYRCEIRPLQHYYTYQRSTHTNYVPTSVVDHLCGSTSVVIICCCSCHRCNYDNIRACLRLFTPIENACAN